MKKFFTKKINVALAAMLCCALWGSAFPVIKIGYGFLNIAGTDTSSQILFAGVRFLLAGFFTILLGSIFADKFIVIKKKENWKKVGVLAVFQTIMQYIFFYVGLAHTTGSKSSILDSTSVFFAVLISCLIFKQEKLTVNKIIGCVVGFVGVVLINLSPGSQMGSFAFNGEGFIILSALSYAFSSVLVSRYSKSESPVALSGYQFMLGGAVMILAGLIFGGRLRVVSLPAFAIIIYLALLSACAYTIWGILLKYNDVSSVSVFGFMTPVFGFALSATILKEQLTQQLWLSILALVLVCLGIFSVNMNVDKLKKHKNDKEEKN